MLVIASTLCVLVAFLVLSQCDSFALSNQGLKLRQVMHTHTHELKMSQAPVSITEGEREQPVSGEVNYPEDIGSEWEVRVCIYICTCVCV